MATEDEEFEFRARLERERGGQAPPRRSPFQMRGEAMRGGPLEQAINYARDPRESFPRAVSRGAYETGGMVTDIAADVGLPPKVAGGLGYGANVALQSLPMMFTGEAAKSIGPSLRDVARGLMQSSIKPTLKQLKSGEAATAIDTLLEKNISPNAEGVRVLRENIAKLNDEIAQAIANSPATVNKAEVAKRLYGTVERFLKQVNPNADANAIRKAWMEFRNHPLLRGVDEIPVQLAQELKRGTYTQLSKKYGELGSSEVEAQKALARGLKEEIAAKVPGIGELNKQESKLLAALNVSERRALMEANKNPGGLALLAHNTAAFTAFMADKSGAFKALVARLLYKGSEQIPATAARAGMIPLSMIGQEQQ